MSDKRRARRIVLGVTSPISLVLMRGFPEYLSKEGWDVHVVSAPGAELDALADGARVRVHRVAMERDPAPLRDLRALVAWVRLLATLRPDVVFVGTPKAGLLGILAAAMVRVPVRIYHVRGLRLETTRGLTRKLLTLLERITLRASSSAVAVSSSLRARLVGLGLVRADRVVVLGHGSSNGVDVAHFQPAPADTDEVARLRAELGLDARVPVVGYVGRIHRDKGLGVLLNASDLLMARKVEHRLMIVGRTEDSVVGGILADMAPDRQPVLTGPVPDAAPYYHVMDVFCLPTFREGFPNVVLEAAASGLPAVTTDATGAIDSVLPGRTGSVSIAGDPQSLADELALVLMDPQKRMTFSANAREFAVQNFSRETVWRNTAKYLADTLSPAGER